MGNGEWPRKNRNVSELLLPRHYGSVPTAYGAPKTDVDNLVGVDAAFMGIPWQAPVPDSRIGAAGANFFGTALTTHTFRTNSVKYTGALPELDVDVWQHINLVDVGDATIDPSVAKTFENVAGAVEKMVRSNVIPMTCGGNSGPSTYAVVQGLSAASDGSVAVFNFDAHGDNHPQKMEDDDPAAPPWGATWALRILDLDQVEPNRYMHFGLRGPRNDGETVKRFVDKGVPRENILTFTDIVKGRRRGFEEWTAERVQPLVEGASKALIVIDPDVLDMATNPDFGDEPLGMHTEELCWAAYQIGKAAGRDRFGGVALTAIPFDAMTLQWSLMYVQLYALAGVIHSESE